MQPVDGLFAHFTVEDASKHEKPKPPKILMDKKHASGCIRQ